MLLPFNVDVPMTRLPVANWVLIAVTVLVSVLTWLTAPAPRAADKRIPAEYRQFYELVKPAEKPAPPLSLRRGAGAFSFLQLFSYVLVHADMFHLLGNMFFLFCFGNAMDAKLGHWPFLGLYFLLGLVAGVAWLILGQGPALVGASGAIMGIVGLFLVFYPRNDVRAFRLGIGGVGAYEVPSYWIVLVGMAADLWGSLVSYGTVAYICHLAGELCGIVVAIGLLLTGWVESEHYEENLLQLLGLQEKDDGPRRPVRTGKPSPPMPVKTWRRRR